MKTISIDGTVFNPASLRDVGGRQDCEHDWTDEADFGPQQHAAWRCDECGRLISYDRWQKVPS